MCGRRVRIKGAAMAPNVQDFKNRRISEKVVFFV